MKTLIGFVCAFNVFSQSPPTFEVASIKPNVGGERGIMIRTPPGGGLDAQNVPLRFLVQFAYHVRAFQVTGGPAWINTDRWNINATAEPGATREQAAERLQALLADRFKLTLHRETKESPVYVLVPAKNGMKLPKSKEGGCIELQPNKPPPPLAPGQPPARVCGNMQFGLNGINGSKIDMKFLVTVLSDITGRTVIDKTGFTGTFDAHLEYARDEATAGFAPDAPQPPADFNAPSIFTALQEQLGLKLDSDKAPVEILVIDHAEKASEN